MSKMSNERKRKNKSYYVQSKKSCNGRQFLEPDLKGFLITCSNKSEKQAVREAYNILNEYADRLYGEEVKESCTQSESTEVDFAEAIALQVGAVKSIGKDSLRRFQAVDTKTSNCVFIRTTLEHPADLLLNMMSEIATTGVTKSRFILKIFPVAGTCRSTEDKIEKLVEDLLVKQFSHQSLGSYAILYKVRCNSLGREQILPLVGRVIQQTCHGSKVDLSNPDVMISIDILGKFCCISIMTDFFKFKKYNVQEVGKSVGVTLDTDPSRQEQGRQNTLAKVSEGVTALKSEDVLDVMKAEEVVVEKIESDVKVKVEVMKVDEVAVEKIESDVKVKMERGISEVKLLDSPAPILPSVVQNSVTLINSAGVLL